MNADEPVNLVPWADPFSPPPPSAASDRLTALLTYASESGASDLHLIAGVPPAFRINGEIIFADEDSLSGDECSEIAYSILNGDQQQKFEREWELCVSLPHSVAGRLRATLYKRNNRPEMSIRLCGDRIREREELGLPAKLDELARRPSGLILITGPTGSGKTTTLNYLVDLINRERRCKIVSIEDPIEYVHENKRAIVVQQEVLTDTHSFSRALVHVLRQDPDVIAVGEMRDHETISTALTAAETGHLVLATLHAPSATLAIERIVGVYEGPAQRQVVLQLANSLQGILGQDLVPAADRTRRVLAYELLLASNPIRTMIRENHLHHLENTMQTSGKEGMMLMDGCLYDLYCRCQISYDTALSRARNPENIRKKTS
jgi:twitching motility protein PilT